MLLGSDSSGYIGSALWFVVCSVIFCAIIFGNLLVILAIASCKQLSSVQSNQFVNSLALTDLLVGLYIPYHMLFYLSNVLNESEIACIIRFMVPTFACTHSILKLLTIATDRYIAVIYPLRYSRYMTKKIIWSLIIGGWIIASALSTVPIYWNNWEENSTCDTENFLPFYYFTSMLTPMFGLAWFTMLIVYMKICIEARRHAKRVRKSIKIYLVNDAKSLQVSK